MNYGDWFEKGLTFQAFLARYANAEQHRRWNAIHDLAALTANQSALLRGFRREMKVLVVAGTWCGDCVDQCPIFDRFAAENEMIQLRFFDRDESAELAADLAICGASRVPSVLFLSEDNYPCGRYGDRTLSKYRQMAMDSSGSSCPTGLVSQAGSLLEAVVQDWLDEFERVQLMLRTSARLRQLHGD